MTDTYIVDALQHALENIKGENLPDSHYGNIVDMLNAFNAQYVCAVTFSTTPETAEIVVKGADGNVISADESGKYNLSAGEYTYTAAAEGYTTQSDVELSVSYSDVNTGTKTVTVTLVAE